MEDSSDLPRGTCWSAAGTSDLTPAPNLLTTMGYKTHHKAAHKPDCHQAFEAAVAGSDGVVACAGKAQNTWDKQNDLTLRSTSRTLARGSCLPNDKSLLHISLETQSQILMDSRKEAF